ncbi:MAG: non-hydrolyzing UDP-N-acetylglucosamine 2-epimerase [Deltaproteobacteria bacterium]
MKIINIVGARPNFVKIASLMVEMMNHPRINPLLVHTGQHYDYSMSKLFFDNLGIPEPDINLEVGSASHATQTAQVMQRFEPVLISQKPDLVLVVGDVNSTIACSLTAVKLGIKVAHVEAGLRSFDRAMPEEINRILTDSISDFLFTTERSGNENLMREGVSPEKIFFVGNTMIDSLIKNREKAAESKILETLGLISGEGVCPYAVLTLHRPSNVDDDGTLSNILGALSEVSNRLPIFFPIHPRTRKRIETLALGDKPIKWLDRLDKIPQMRGIYLIEPQGYLDFLRMMSRAKLVLTDSGGIQEETTVLGIPCLTLRENTERPVTVTEGTNVIVGADAGLIVRESLRAIAGDGKTGRAPELWDGNASQRIVNILIDKLSG